MSIDANHRLGQRLKELRKANKLTLKQVADQLGMTPTAISLYESETRTPSMDMLQKLAKIYGTKLVDLTGDDDELINLENVLSNKNLHWHGIPLREDELNFIKQFLEIRVKDKEALKKEACNHEDKIC